MVTSRPASLTLTLEEELIPPKLYVLAIGINRYRDKSLWLKYAVPDAQSLVEELKQASGTLYQDIRVATVLDDQATLTGIGEAFDKISKEIEPQDVFVLYLSGHGITQDGTYHFLPHNFRYVNENSVREKSINQGHLQTWLASVQARKSVILMDTCNSGSFNKAVAVERGIKEKTAINKLTRATGRTTIVASTDDQPALEGYKGHGVFTYVLLDGLKKADSANGNNDGMVGVFELAAFLNEQVPEIAYKAFGFEQVPQVKMEGRDFPLVTVNKN